MPTQIYEPQRVTDLEMSIMGPTHHMMEVEREMAQCCEDIDLNQIIAWKNRLTVIRRRIREIVSQFTLSA